MPILAPYRGFQLTFVQRRLEAVAEAVRRILSRTGRSWSVYERPADLASLYEVELPPNARRPKDVALFYAPVAIEAWTAMFTNYEDGWLTLRNCISGELRCRTYHFGFTADDVDYPAYRFEQLESGEEARVVQLLRDGARWQFFEKGTPLAVEDLAAYRCRKRSERMSRGRLLDLARRLGFDLEDDRFLGSTKSGVYFEAPNREREVGSVVFHPHHD